MAYDNLKLEKGLYTTGKSFTRRRRRRYFYSGERNDGRDAEGQSAV